MLVPPVGPLSQVSVTFFPYILFLTTKLLDEPPQVRNGGEREELNRRHTGR